MLGVVFCTVVLAACPTENNRKPSDTNESAVVSVSASAASIAEDGGTADFVIEAMPAPTGDVTVSYTIAGSNGAVDADVDVALADLPVPQTIMLTAPNYSHTITVTGQDDDTFETDTETVTITLTSASGGGADLGTATTASFTITDDDTPVVSVSASAASIAEDGGTADFVIEVMPAPTGDVTVGYTIAGSNGAVDADVDVALADPPAPQTITLTAPDYSHTITVTGQDDDTPEADDETVTITLTSASGGGADLGTATTASFTITDDEPRVSVSASAASIAEDGGTADFVIEVMPAPTGDVTVGYTIAGSNGAVDADVDVALADPPAPQTITLTAPGYSHTITVTGQDDDTIEAGDETVTITLTSASGGGAELATGTAITASIAIIEDDMSIVSVSTSAASLAENGSTASFIIEAMPKPDDGEITVRLRVDYVGGAGAGDVLVGSGIGFFSVNTLSARNNYRSTILVRSKVDTIPNESGEGVKISLTSLTRGANIATIGIATATITIIDDD